MLFLKRISDTWKWEHKAALERFDGDAVLAALPENHVSRSPRGACGMTCSGCPKTLAPDCSSSSTACRRPNPSTLAGVFGTVQWANKEVLPEQRLIAVLDVFTTLKLDPGSVTHDLLGNGYEFLLKNFADESGKKAGEFFTPRAVVRLLVELFGPQGGGKHL